jgi:hypothetical protein
MFSKCIKIENNYTTYLSDVPTTPKKINPKLNVHLGEKGR